MKGGRGNYTVVAMAMSAEATTASLLAVVIGLAGARLAVAVRVTREVLSFIFGKGLRGISCESWVELGGSS